MKTNSPAPTVSIILSAKKEPVCLKETMDDILRQTLKELEVIVIIPKNATKVNDICEAYCEEDTRVRICGEEEGSIVSRNVALNTAKGDYILFVEQGDRIEREMLAELYSSALEYGADVIQSPYSITVDGGKTKIVNYYLDFPFFFKPVREKGKILPYIKGASVIAGRLFRTRALERTQIKFPEIASHSLQNIAFILQTYVKLNIFFISSRYYLTKGENTSKNAPNRNVELMDTLYLVEWFKNWMQPGFTSQLVRDSIIALLLNYFQKKYYTISAWPRLFAVRKASFVIRQILDDPNYRTSSLHKKKNFIRLALHPVWYYLRTAIYERKKSEGREYIKILGIKIRDEKETAKGKRKKIIGISYYKSIRHGKDEKGYFLGIPVYSVVRKEGLLIARIFGIRYKTFPIKKAELAMEFEEKVFRMSCYANAVAALHGKVFPKYKASLTGKDVMIVATGPTVAYAPIFPQIKHLAVNRAITLKKFKFDYFFAVDYRAIRDFSQEIIEFDGHKFLGKYIFIDIHWSCIPDSLALAANAERYYVESPFGRHAHCDIEFQPLAVFGTVVHSALSFLLYTHPRRIYLVGCDTSNTGYFDDKVAQMPMDLAKLKAGYEKMKLLRDWRYPDVEIVSINPIGLKGLFRDIYTRSYLNANPDICESLNKNITVIENCK